MIRPLSSATMLATSMQAQAGVYAVLLGSGVSTGAGILTGWGVVAELVRRLAVADSPGDEDSLRAAEADPEAWWQARSPEPLGYSSLLKSLSPTSATRQGLLADFFEPTPEDRENGVKIPSAAHLALAELVKRGAVRVILTTNFDRLMEQALDTVGVSPQVIARPEAVKGMTPLTHAPATLIKLHGDYKDLESRNTPEELERYPAEWKTLLGQILDEYGLVVAGWSAEWDTALVRLIEESPSRRYPLFWDSRSSKGDVAQRLLTTRRGQIITAPGADELFSDLLASVEALDRLMEPPLTTAMAVARLKRYLPEPARRIDLHDLVMSIVDDVTGEIAEQPLSADASRTLKVYDLWEKHRDATNPLLELLITGVWHDPEGTHDGLWMDTLQRLIDAGTAPIHSCTSGWDDARLFPALLAHTAMGMAAVRRGREELIIRLSTEVEGRGRMGTGELLPAAQLLHPNRVIDGSWVNAMPRWDGGTWRYPSSHLLKADIHQGFQDFIPLEHDYVQTFHVVGSPGRSPVSV
ncbi:SIR2 family protein [Gordonia rubripertincta]|uniref:SIR2 family protein n=1 Tax=Gordonia rubripertincta TaxID=36822 RepID=UPI0015F89F4F|nr:SIR2 family protein [Gordonia rubripertincta]QMU23450.1 SIR2 family protein [Gordonia rubripertincta]